MIGLSACNSETGSTNGYDEVIRGEFTPEKFTTVIDTDSGLLAEPIELIGAGEGRLAIMDYGLNRILLFDDEGNQLQEMGGTGSGPGEWSQMSGAGDLIFTGNHFIVSNRERFHFDIFDNEGSFERSVSYPRYMNYGSKAGIDENRLLVATQGHDDALAVVLDLSLDGEILKRIGTPEAEVPERPNLEEDRLKLAGGEIPGWMKNEALVGIDGEDYILFMYGMGELRRYSSDGERVWSRKIPNEITEPILRLVIEQNAESPPHSVFRLQYAREMRVTDDSIYLLTASFPDSGVSGAYLLRYSLEGELLEQKFVGQTSYESMIMAMLPGEDGSFHFLDYAGATLLRYSP